MPKLMAMKTLNLRRSATTTTPPRKTNRPWNRRPHLLIHFRHHLQNFLVVFIAQEHFKVPFNLIIRYSGLLSHGSKNRLVRACFGVVLLLSYHPDVKAFWDSSSFLTLSRTSLIPWTSYKWSKKEGEKKTVVPHRHKSPKRIVNISAGTFCIQQLTSCQFSKFNLWPHSQQQLSISALQACHIFVFFFFCSPATKPKNTTLFTHSLLFFHNWEIFNSLTGTFPLCSTSKSCVLTFILNLSGK